MLPVGSNVVMVTCAPAIGAKQSIASLAHKF
jgi:hypothetical protein